MNINYKYAFETTYGNESYNITENDLSQIQYYDKTIEKQRVSYNSLLLFIQKCTKIIIHKNNVINKLNICFIFLLLEKVCVNFCVFLVFFW